MSQDTRRDSPALNTIFFGEHNKIASLPRTERGEWYGLPIPTSFEQLQGAGFGAAWLSRAMHAAGTLPADCAVRRLVAVHELDLAGKDAQGGIGRAGSQTLDELL